jgi:hypothetical protein
MEAISGAKLPVEEPSMLTTACPGPPPGMPSAPGMAPPPGAQQPVPATQANRPSTLPPNFQPPPGMSGINFSAPVIRLGATNPPAKPSPAPNDRRESNVPTSAGGRAPTGGDRGLEQSRAQVRESMQALVPPTEEEKLRTIFLHRIPEGVGGEAGIEALLRTVGSLRRWDGMKSQETEHPGELFGFAQFEDPESLAVAVELLNNVEVPVKRQLVSDKEVDERENFDGIEKTTLHVEVDPHTLTFLETVEARSDKAAVQARLDAARASLRSAVRELFYPRQQGSRDDDGDSAMADASGAAGDNVEVINISLQQEDELADIPAAMREVVAAEIAAFRERSNQRDLERLRREEEMEEAERRRNGALRPSRAESPGAGPSNSIPLGPRGVPNAPSGPRAQAVRGLDFVNGGTNGHLHREEEESEASDEELHRKELAKQKAEDDRLYSEAERKWLNRERQKMAALNREKERDRAQADGFDQRRADQIDFEKNWDDERESTRKRLPYYSDHAGWVRRRTQEREEEKVRDQADRAAEAEERRREAADMDRARGMADSFLDQHARELERRSPEPAEPIRLKIAFGEAAKTQAQRGGTQRRTVAEVEGLLDDEEADGSAKRTLVPIKFEPLSVSDTKAMSEEDIGNAIKALAQEIPTEKEGLWAWNVKWDYLEDTTIREKLRPFVE